MAHKTITSDQLATPAGPFSIGAQSGDLLLLSGQVAQDPATGALIDGDITAQTNQVLRNLTEALKAAGKDLSNVIRVGVYLTDMGNFAAMNDVYKTYFTAPYPARTAIGVVALPLGAIVEVDAIAE
jgi:2-iminobutanoate/2-iminopropanoate deaminase